MRSRHILAAWLGLAGVLGLALVFAGCSTAHDPWAEVEGAAGARRVLVTFPPLYCFARNVAGEHARVLSLVTTVGPHDYSPSGLDALKAVKANLLLANGLGLDEWYSKVKNSSGNEKLVVVEVGEKLPEEFVLQFKEEKDDHDQDKHQHQHKHGSEDPHVWLGLPQAKKMVDVIRDQLIDLDPQHKKDYRANAAAYQKKLDELYHYGKKKFQDKASRRIIAMHDSMQYFAKAFDLEVVDSIQGQPGVEPSGRKMEELVKKATDLKAPVRVITHEPQYSQKVADNLLRRIKQDVPDAKLVLFDTLETAPSAEELTPGLYIETMRANINKLAEALK